MSAVRRLAPLSGLAAVVFIVVGLGMDAAPTSSWPDARIHDWYAGHSLSHWFISAYILAAGAPLLLMFVATVHERMAQAGVGRGPRTLTLGAGVAFAVTVLIGAGLYAAVPAGITFSKAPAPSADVSRYMLGASYGVLVMFSAFAAALLAGTISVVSLRFRVLPRPLALIGIPASVLMLANAVMPMAVISLWFTAASIGLSIQRHDLPASVAALEPAPA
ncbi:MAG TPA: hypothetical protein VF317_07435 [Dermatophilaceae bacterium]|jgi:hypothetical protein